MCRVDFIHMLQADPTPIANNIPREELRRLMDTSLNHDDDDSVSSFLQQDGLQDLISIVQNHYRYFDTNYALLDRPTYIEVEGAGNPVVNGIYVQEGILEGARRYVRNGVLWNNSRHQFNIFLCNVSNNEKYWYISIVPNGGNPGTSLDIDFYTAPSTESSMTVAATLDWTKTGEGRDPAPQVIHRDRNAQVQTDRDPETGL
jgi:hypothetical protein